MLYGYITKHGQQNIKIIVTILNFTWEYRAKGY